MDSFDLIFSAWMLSVITLGVLLSLLSYCIYRRILKLEKAIEKIDEKVFQIALMSRFTPPQLEYEKPPEPLKEKQKGGWPKGKLRKPAIEL